MCVFDAASFFSVNLNVSVYQTTHLWVGFILEPSGQLKSFENSSMLLMGPNTRNCPGECTPVVMRIFIVSVSITEKLQVKD